jgi:hypothetical protein
MQACRLATTGHSTEADALKRTVYRTDAADDFFHTGNDSIMLNLQLYNQ